MLKYHLFTSFRSIKRNLSFSIINISGLALGLTLVITMLAWLQFELSFDKFHVKSGKIFRVVAEFNREKISDHFANTPAPLGNVLSREIPEVEDFVRFGNLGRVLVNSGEVQFWENIELADPSIFNIFSFILLEGNPETALTNPRSIILNETKARKYFGNTNPLGQQLYIGEDKTPFIITGVLKDIPANSQIQFEFLSSFSEDRGEKSWGTWNYTTYILARRTGSYRAITGKLPDIISNIPVEEGLQLHIQPLLKIHLHSNLRSDIANNTNIKTLYIVSSMLVLVLLIACINYMNLATSQYSKRGKEAGLRKVAGATNSNLAVQFLVESFAVTLSAFIIAIFLVYLLIPVFNSISDFPLKLGSLFTFGSVVRMILLVILISFIAGSYPALFLSSVNPVSTMRDDFKLSRLFSVRFFRKVLVVFQFTISIALIACSITIKSQLAYIKNKDLGLNSEQVVVVPIYQELVRPKYELFKKEISVNPAILNASAVAYFTGTHGYFQNTWWEGLAMDDNTNYIDWISVDQDFIRTLKIELLKGEFFPGDISSNKSVCYVLNESAVRMTGWNDPIRKQFDIIGKGEVVGVVKDFNFKSLHDELKPLAMTYYAPLFDNLIIRISGENITGTLDYLKRTWDNLFPWYPFEFRFLSEDIQNMYLKETRSSLIITAISFLALFVSCIGLFGLVLFTVDSRIKEIGIRKVAGSTTGRIVMMLNLQYVKYILLAFIIAFPIVYYSMVKWLQNFAYRIDLSWWMFAISGAITVLISMITVSWHTWKTATRNPVDCLRHE